jgi:small subunit ribosomal protein S17
MVNVRDIGIDVRAPAREPAPGDRLNPFNGTLPVRGSTIVGTVVTARMQGTVIVEKQHERNVQKFERIERRTRRYPAHVPSNIDVKVGDEVMIAECRPISKTVNFVVVENRGNAAEAHREAAKAKAPATGAATSAPRKTAAAKPSGEGAPKKAAKSASSGAKKAAPKKTAPSAAGGSTEA